MNNEIIKVNGDFEVIKTNQKRNKTMSLTEKWTKVAADKLVGRKIVKVEYMSGEEVEEMGWFNRPVCIMLDNGAWIYPQMDDEGNDAGVIYYSGTDKDDGELFPVLQGGD